MLSLKSTKGKISDHDTDLILFDAFDAAGIRSAPRLCDVWRCHEVDEVATGGFCLGN